MASNGSNGNLPNAPAAPSVPNQRGGRSRGGRGRGGGGHLGPAQNGGELHRGGRRGRGRGGGRDRNDRNGTTNDVQAMSASDLTARLSQVAASKAPAVKPPGAAAEDGDSEHEVCFLCASDISFQAVPLCNHWTCHVCALRMRALMSNKACSYCKADVEYVIFTDDATKRYEDFVDADFVTTDTNIGIKYANTESLEDTIALLQYRCPYPGCDVACAGWPGLHHHVKDVHQRKMCNFCIKHKKVFTHEVQLFTDQELKTHMRDGDDRPGAVDQTGFKGHPLCGFCGSRHYGPDELYDHLKKSHEKCFICTDRNPGHQPVYFTNISALQDHYKAEHFLCSAPECVDQKLIVFATEMDLKAHQLEVHGNTLSKDVRRDARMVDISGFNYREPYQQPARERRDARGRGRGRDPNSEPLPASSAQPMRRDEQAFQRQMAIQSAQSVAPRTFGGQLTSTPAAPIASSSSRTANANPTMQSGDVREAGNAALNVTAESRPAPANLTPQDQARAIRHSAVIDRASSLLRNDQSKLTQFRNTISSYQRNGISATALIESFQSLFDTASSTLGTLIREIADIFEDPAKANSLRAAWNDWRAINEDYPSLPGLNLTNNSIPLGWATSGSSSTSRSAQNSSQNSSRILKLKSSTAQSLRSFNSGSPSRSSKAKNNHATNVAFPGLPTPAAGSGSSNRSGAGRGSATPWANASASTNQPSISTTTSRKPSPPISRPESRTTRGGATGDAFPALPPAAKPLSSITGHGGRLVRRDLGGSTPSGFSWGGSGTGSGSATPNDAAEGEPEVSTGGGKKKGNKGKKQVLMNWG